MNSSLKAGFRRIFGSLLETQLYADIPLDLSSLEFIESHSILCGISTLRKMVAFSEPYLHHSFPIENYVRFGDTPRRVVANRTTTFVLTDGYPYLMPTTPGRAARTPVPIEQALPIIAPRSAAVFAHGVVYASTDGLVMITNSGAGKQTPCGIYHDYGAEVAAGKRQDDAFFAFICGVDEGDDPLADEGCWPKANPSLQHRNLPGLQYLREQVTEARGMPAKEAIVRRLNFCQWTAAEAPWLSAAVWDPCQRPFTVAQLRGRRAWGGLDLSSTTDLTAFVLLVEPAADGEPWHILPWCWLPAGDSADSLRQRSDRDRVDYVTWARGGYLETTPGAAISKRAVLQRVAQICADFDVQSIAADRWRLADFKQQAEDDGITLPELVEFGQGFKDMSPALDEFETAILNRTVAHNGHPVLTWCAANAVTDSDPAGNRKLNKAKAKARIDLVVAAVMAYASAAPSANTTEKSWWEVEA